MDVMQVLQELARHPLPDAAFAQAARALVLHGTSTPVAEPAVAAGSLSKEPPVAVRPPLAAPKARVHAFERITVKDPAGHRTTVSLTTEVFAQAAQKLGGNANVTELVRELSRRSPPELQNRSGWILDRIRERLAETPDTRTLDIFGEAGV